MTFVANQTSLGLTFETDLDNSVEGTEGFRVTPLSGSTYLSGGSADVRITDLPALVWVSPLIENAIDFNIDLDGDGNITQGKMVRVLLFRPNGAVQDLI